MEMIAPQNRGDRERLARALLERNRRLRLDFEGVPRLSGASISDGITQQAGGFYIPYLSKTVPTLLNWMLEHRRMLGPAQPFTIFDHVYLMEIYNNPPGGVVMKKSAQSGLSEWAVSKAFYTCMELDENVIYIMPRGPDVYDFSQMRFDPALEASESLRRAVYPSNTPGRSTRRGKDRTTLKRVTDNFIVFRSAYIQQVRGRDRATQLKSVPAGSVILDEMDDMPEKAVEMAEKRVGHSYLKEIIKISTPSYTGMGIDSAYERTDKRQWFVPCPHCGRTQPMNIGMCIVEEDDAGRPVYWHGMEQGRAWLACNFCGGEMDRLARGEWVAEHPSRILRGYHIHKLMTPHADVLPIVEGLQDFSELKRQEVFNQDLGLGYTPKGDSLSVEELDACRRNYRHGPVGGASYMGVDVGRYLHAVIRAAPDEHGIRRQLWCGAVSEFEELEPLMTRYRVTNCVVDALPETREAKRFQEKYPIGRVWLAFYNEKVNQDAPNSWNPGARTVTASRTWILDGMMALFYAQENTLPAHIRRTKDYYEHMGALVRVKQLKRDGTEWAQYVNNSPDHYAHAETYSYIASGVPRQKTGGGATVVRRAKGGWRVKQ